MKKVINISNLKGGVGKSSVSNELAYLFGQNYKTLLIDLDAQRNSSIYSGADMDHKGIYDLLTLNVNSPDEAIQHTHNYDIMVASKQMANAAKEFGDPDDIYMLQDVLEALDYEIVILDHAPARSPLLFMGYIAATDFILIGECDRGSDVGIRENYDDIQRFIKRGTCKGEFNGILLNKYENTTMHKLSYDRLVKLGEEIGVRVYKTRIRKSIVASEAKEAKEPVQIYERFNNFAVDSRNLYKEIVEKWS